MNPTSLEQDIRVSPGRVKQLIVAIGVAAAMDILRSAMIGHWNDLAILGLSAIPLLLAWRLVDFGRTEIAGQVMLFALTCMVNAFVWRNAGLQEPAVVAYPTILMLGGMLFGRRAMLSIMAAIILFLAVLTAADAYGWHTSAPPSSDAANTVSLIAILAVTAIVIWMVNGDFKALIGNLLKENILVTDSRERIDYLARHDHLTGLPNRVQARELFLRTIARANEDGGKVGLIHLDLDDFKSANATLGHVFADRMLKQIPERLTKELREHDSICRLGGDEFLILIDALENSDSAMHIAGRLLERFSEPLEIDGVHVMTGCSMGISVYPDDGIDFDTLLRHADIAMHTAKDAGRNDYRLFAPSMTQEKVSHMRLNSAMRHGLSRNEFSLHFQPQFDLKSGRIVGAEALLRWQHGDFGNVSPAEFIPIAEKSGLIVPLGEWVLQEACRHAVQWKALGLGNLVVAVNVSPVQVRRGGLEAMVMRALESSGLNPSLLELELTESSLLHDSAEFSRSLSALRQLGVGIAIDDFGTGYSNLGYLKKFEVQLLKIDQSFVRRMTQDRDDETIVRAITQMAKGMRLRTLAEGVEDVGTLRLLAGLGCDVGQGYLWARPMPASEFTEFVRHQAAHPKLHAEPTLHSGLLPCSAASHSTPTHRDFFA